MVLRKDSAVISVDYKNRISIIKADK